VRRKISSRSLDLAEIGAGQPLEPATIAAELG
jgi:hypothetical protein